MADPAKLAAAAEAASAAEKATGCPAALLVAQWALESGWGASQPGNNCFGIKNYPGSYGRQLLHTVEWFTVQELRDFLGPGGRTAELDATSTFVTSQGRRKYKVTDWFATFKTLADCFLERAKLFGVGRYRPFAEAYLQDHDLTKLIKGIGPIYATDPDYAKVVLDIVGQENVQLALNEAGSGPPEIVA